MASCCTRVILSKRKTLIARCSSGCKARESKVLSEKESSKRSANWRAGDAPAPRSHQRQLCRRRQLVDGSVPFCIAREEGEEFSCVAKPVGSRAHLGRQCYVGRLFCGHREPFAHQGLIRKPWQVGGNTEASRRARRQLSTHAAAVLAAWVAPAVGEAYAPSTRPVGRRPCEPAPPPSTRRSEITPGGPRRVTLRGGAPGAPGAGRAAALAAERLARQPRRAAGSGGPRRFRGGCSRRRASGRGTR